MAVRDDDRSFDDADAPPAPRLDTGRVLRIAAVVVVALGGWAWGAWQHFVVLPRSADIARIGTALDLVDRFVDTPAHVAYVQLADDMKPWWDQIDDLQRRIQAEGDDGVRDGLIAERDASLVAFVREHRLGDKIDLLIGSFDEFTRCLDTARCDEDTIARAISIDVKRIYRTYRPYILHRRGDGRPEDRDYGHHLEDLYFRLVG
ncbi:hypothetical protein EYW49_18145 [Siculibacillus lacustris]|uniref:Uncharacterized protein n=1 Tax=Siculibacillus lacustris TaxID=1549641 RepID=A0A4Q9VHB4_9HYPH|nr:hypothetical protein [Siculibacillus lacustris]TBW34508.1 hypothetical protein EYW49_18145 [Siculibacillus lacustris]